jgi:hypothetical protein
LFNLPSLGLVIRLVSSAQALRATCEEGPV